MAEYEDQFEKHPAHGLLDQLEAALNQEFKHELEGAIPDHIDRLTQAISFIRKQLNVASPVLNSAARLNGISSGLQNALKEVNQFSANGNPAHLSNASNQLDGPLATAALLITMPEGPPSVSATDAISFKRIADQIIKQLRDQVAETVEVQEKLNGTASNLAEKLASVKSQLESVEATAASKLEEIQATYNSAETVRRTEFGEGQKQRDKQFSDRLEELSESSAGAIVMLDQKQREAARIVQLIGNIGLTGNYKGAFAEEKHAADRLRSQALWCFVGAFVVMAGTLILTAIEGFHPWLALFRMGSALFLLVPGAYAAKESSRHRANENRHRRSELELATIDTYLESLPPEKRDEIKAQLTPEFFGQKVAPEQDHETEITGKALIDLLKDAIVALSKK